MIKNRKINVFEKYDLKTNKNYIFFLEITENCNYLCIIGNKFLFEHSNSNEKQLKELDSLKTFFESAEDLKEEASFDGGAYRVPLMPNGIYKGFSYNQNEKPIDLENTSIREYKLEKELSYGIVFMKDSKKQIHAFTKVVSYKKETYYRIKLFNNKKGKFLNSLSLYEDIQDIAINFFSYISRTFFNMEKINESPLNLGYEAVDLRVKIENRKTEIEKIDFSQNSILRKKDIDNLIKSKGSTIDDFYIKQSINNLKNFNLEKLNKIYLFNEYIDAPGHYDSKNYISFSTTDKLPTNKKNSYTLLGEIQV